MLKIEVSKSIVTDSRFAGILNFSSRSLDVFKEISSNVLLTGT